MLVKKSKTWDALALALFMNAHSEFFYPLTINYMGLGDKEIFSTALLHLGMPYGLVPHGRGAAASPQFRTSRTRST